MPNFGQFELIEPVRIAAVETWLAREGNSERLLLLHKFSKESGMRERLLTMKPNDLIMLLRAGEENGVCFVVTYDTPELRDFGRWVNERAAMPAKPNPVPENEPGEFTRMFSIPPPAAQSSPEPGEFTRIFQLPVSSPAPSQPQPPSSVKATNEPGEFTRFFSNPLTSSTLPEKLNNPAVGEPEPRVAQEPGEFTRQFGPQSFTNRVEPPPPDKPGATAVFSVPQAAQETPSAGAGEASSPGEYTRIFEGPQRPAPVSEPSSPSATSPLPAPPPPRNYVPLILILSALALAAFTLIFYFLLRR